MEKRNPLTENTAEEKCCVPVLCVSLPASALGTSFLL